jgi:hypothetical protein
MRSHCRGLAAAAAAEVAPHQSEAAEEEGEAVLRQSTGAEEVVEVEGGLLLLEAVVLSAEVAHFWEGALV